MELGLNNDCHLFVEKPISDNLKGLEDIKKSAEKKKKIIYVACNMRFHPSIKKIEKLVRSEKLGTIFSVRCEFGHYLPNWRPGSDYSKHYSANKEQGGGILLDSIHEFDYLLWMFGGVREVFAIADKQSDLKINVSDNAEILLKFASNMVGEVHLDYLQRCKRRSCQVIGSKGTVIWVSTGKKPEESEFKHYDSSKDTWNISKEIVDIDKPYIDQTKHFLACLRGEEKPVSTFGSGVEALELVLAAKESSLKKKSIELLEEVL